MGIVQIATIIGREVYDAAGMRVGGEPDTQARAVAVHDDPRAYDQSRRSQRRRKQPVTPLDPVDEIASLLARAARLTQALGDRDRERARSFFEATCQLVYATTRLDDSDQRKFEQALRNA